MGWKTLDDINLDGKTVLVRVDINVPVKDGVVTDATRIKRIVPTIKDIQAAGGKPVLMAHFGRPKGKVVPELSLKVTLPALEEAFGQPVIFADETEGKRAGSWINEMNPGDIVLLENLRFHPGEEANDPTFAAELASLGDVYCNDAFSVSHRAHASTEAIAHLLPACAGRLMQAELSALEAALGNPEHPVCAVVGGAKVSTKLDLLGNLVTKVDYLIIGGGMANTFLAAQGVDVGKSLAEHEMKDTALEILAKAKDANCEIILPTDIVVAREFKENADYEVLPVDACPPDAMILDAGPKTVERITTIIESSKTLIMNGPLGVFEMPPFHAATFAMLFDISKQTKAGALVSIAGGGDTVAAINAAGYADDFTYISTAGGAFLEWMEGKTLPGVAALEGA